MNNLSLSSQQRRSSRGASDKLANITSPALVETVAFALAFAAITILHIVLGELAPKSLAIRKAVPTKKSWSSSRRCCHWRN
jgi:CBS domain containing-hemolysin-like protein